MATSYSASLPSPGSDANKEASPTKGAGGDSTVAPTCPACGHTNIRWDLTCHTWPGGTRADGTEQWMSCQGCDSALRISCHCWLDDEVPNPDDPDGLWIYREPDCTCDWDYTWGLNPRNPRKAREEESRPPWLTADMPETTKNGFLIPPPGVRSSYD